MLKLSLHQPTEPFWIDFPKLGCRIQVRPLTLAVNGAIDSYVRKRIAAVATEHIERKAAGAPLDGLPNWSDPDVVAGHSRELMALAVARFGIVAWEGVLDEQTDEPLPVTPDAAEAFARQVGEDFVVRYQQGLAELAAEGNASGAGRNGASAPKATTAPAASQVH